jgi:hypothetical protein
MASPDFLQEHNSDLYGGWTDTALINEPTFLEFCPQFDEPFDFSIGANVHERQRVDSVTESLSLTTSTATDPKYELAYTPAKFTYGYQDLPDPAFALSTYSCDTESTLELEEVSQQLKCSECSKTFSNLRTLDKHTQSTSHKAWRCREPGCWKSYARRDTFLRHRSTHSDNSHTCLDCLRDGKKKAFKRKDHLSEHIRSCHPKCNDGTRSVLVLCHCWTRMLMSSIRTNVDHARDPNTETSRSDNPSQVLVDPRIPTTPQKQAMLDLLNSLRAVLGDRHPNLMGALDSLVSLSGSDMEIVAKTVAHTLLAVRFSPAPE